MNTEPGHCIVNNEHCFIFIPKVASHTMAYALVDETLAHHDHFVRNPDILEEHIIVTMLRDPLERFVSAYNYPGWHQSPGAVPPPEECLGMQDGHFASQKWFLNGVQPDHIFDLTDIENCAKLLKIKFPMKWRNQQQVDRFEQHRTPELEQKIRDYYKEDYVLRARLL